MKRKLRVSSIATLMAMLFCSNVNAQSTEVSADKKTKEEETSEGYSELSLGKIFDVIVSVSSLFQESDLDVASSVYAISNQGWKKQGALRTFDAIRRAPGVMVYDSNYYTAGPTISSRGFMDPGEFPSFSVLIDGINLSSIYQQSALLARPSIELGVLDKMEMIIGPGSVLYGSDALQGVVSMITPDISKDYVSAEAAGGVFGNYRAETKLAHELAPNLHFGLNVAVSGQVDQNTQASFQSTTPAFTVVPGVPLALLGADGSSTLAENMFSYGLVSKLKYRDAQASFYYLGYSGKGFPGSDFIAQSPATLPAPNTVDPTSGGPLFFQLAPGGGQSNTNSSIIIGKLEQEIPLPNNINLTATGYYWNGTTDQIQGNNVGAVNPAIQNNVAIQDLRAHGGAVAKHIGDEKFPIKVAAGYSFDYTQLSNVTEILKFSPSVLPTLPSGGTIISDAVPANGKNRSIHGLFLETDTPIIGRTLHLLLDGREDFYSDFGNHFSPRAGIILQPQDTIALKLLYAHGFRAPSEIELNGLPQGVVANLKLNPDTMDTIQLQYLQRVKTWKLEASTYMSLWDNQIIVNPTGGPGGFPQYQNNPSQSKAYGVDLSGQVIVVSNFSLNATGSYVTTSGKPGGSRTNYPLFPSYILNWGLEYRIPTARLNFALFNRHQWNQNRFILGPKPLVYPGQIIPETMDAYFRTDLAVNWDFGKTPGTFEAFLNIRDLFNLKTPQAAVTSNYNGQVPGAGLIATVGLRASM